MAGFKMLKDISTNFNEELNRMNEELFSANSFQSSEEALTKKLDDLKLFSSKYHLLHAKELAETPQIVERIQNQANIIEDYGEAARKCVLERAVVKSLTQSCTLKKFLTTPDHKLEPEMMERKRKILTALKEFRDQESVLRHLNTVLNEKKAEYAEVRERWDEQLTELTEAGRVGGEGGEEESPQYRRLQILSEKMEMSRWLLRRLVVAPTPQYDWMADPRNLISVMALTRRRCDVASFMDDDEDA